MPVYLTRMAELTAKLFFEGLSEKEEKELQDIINRSPQKRELFNKITSPDLIKEGLKKMNEIDLKADWKKIRKRIPDNKRVKLGRRFRFAAAAIVIICTILLWPKENKRENKLGHSDPTGILDSIVINNKAILQMKNAGSILLDTISEGKLLLPDSSFLQKDITGIHFTNPNIKSKAIPGYKKLWTLSCSKYPVYLPDGTLVDLGANSSIEFSSPFENERRITIEGVAYLKVAKDTAWPFKIKVHNVEIEVLGTNFTISAYKGKKAVEIVLIEGSLRVKAGKASQKLSAGNKTEIINGVMKKPEPADTLKATAWRRGMFIFNGDDLESAMSEVSHYYGMQVHFNVDNIKRKFSAQIFQNQPLDSVLHKLGKAANVRCKVENNKIVVSPG